jgi:hypothetical protein
MNGVSIRYSCSQIFEFFHPFKGFIIYLSLCCDCVPCSDVETWPCWQNTESFNVTANGAWSCDCVLHSDVETWPCGQNTESFNVTANGAWSCDWALRVNAIIVLKFSQPVQPLLSAWNYTATGQLLTRHITHRFCWQHRTGNCLVVPVLQKCTLNTRFFFFRWSILPAKVALWAINFLENT